jgi:hypothetical protein
MVLDWLLRCDFRVVLFFFCCFLWDCHAILMIAGEVEMR